MKFQLGFLVFFVCVMIAVAEDTPSASTEKVCEAGKEFTRNCSICKCNAEGTQYTCEKKECSETQKVSEPNAQTAEEKCTPGENFKIKCNECKCPESGLKTQAACTVIACPDE